MTTMSTLKQPRIARQVVTSNEEPSPGLAEQNMPAPEVPEVPVPHQGHPKLVWMTPNRARYFLEKLHPRQRGQIKLNLALIESELQDGNWHLTHQAAAISTAGELLDARHRLQAIANTGVAVWMWVFFDMPEKTMAFVDTGRHRSTEDHAKVLGMEWKSSHIATAIAIHQGIGCGRPLALSHSRKLDIVNLHAEAVQFAHAITGTHKELTGKAYFRAVLGRAWYTQDRALIEQFARIVRTGDSERSAQEDSSSVRLHTYFSGVTFGSQQLRQEAYCKGQRCLYAFLRKEYLQRTMECAQELFPLPGDEKYPSVPLLRMGDGSQGARPQKG